MWHYNSVPYWIDNLEGFIECVKESNIEIVPKNKKNDIYYLNIPCAFDIETSSTTIDNEKFATMYVWQLGINGYVLMGRTWQDFLIALEEIKHQLNLSEYTRLIIYVHNLAYEFAFIGKLFKWEEVFAIKQRRPIMAISGAFEFRCSYILSNYNLAYIGNNLLLKYPIKKLVGTLEYDLVRHSRTKLFKEEIEYCVHDVLVVMAFIQEKIENEGGIAKIPLTNTGYVRRFCRDYCFKENKESYASLIKSLRINDNREYSQLQRAFMGGYTHAGILHCNKVIESVASYDIASAYPYAMVTNYFPMSKGKFLGCITNENEFEYLIEKYCCIFDIILYDVNPIVEHDVYLSSSKCVCENDIKYNGRIVSAKKLKTTVTELDFDIITRCYSFSKMQVLNMTVYERGYLPKQLIMAILELYQKKTILKNIKGKEVEYMVSKNMINASYGMAVTNIIREMFSYSDGEWDSNIEDMDKQLNKYNYDYQRFLSYPWGIYVTAHTRYRLWNAIFEVGNDFVYADTDSVKFINAESHKQYFEYDNICVRDSIIHVANHYGIDINKYMPRTSKGDSKMIGVWEYEGTYSKFKTCGAKRYIYEYQNGFVTFTVSGLNKKHAMPYLIKQFNEMNHVEFMKLKDAYLKDDIEYIINQDYSYEMIFEIFGDGMYIPAEFTGKLTMSYNDNSKMALLTDYMGVTAFCAEGSFVHAEKQDYYMSMFEGLKNALQKIKQIEY